MGYYRGWDEIWDEWVPKSRLLKRTKSNLDKMKYVKEYLKTTDSDSKENEETNENVKTKNAKDKPNKKSFYCHQCGKMESKLTYIIPLEEGRNEFCSESCLVAYNYNKRIINNLKLDVETLKATNENV